MSSVGLVFYLRYVLLINAVAALIPALAVRGREHDPLLNAHWWPHEYHSGVLVVFMAAVVGTGFVYGLLRRRITRWWPYSFCGGFVGAFPGLFYMVAMPRIDLDRAPQFLPFFAAMAVAGFIWGALTGLITFAALGRRQQVVRS